MKCVPFLFFMSLKTPRAIISGIIGCIYVFPFFLFRCSRYFRQFVCVEQLEARGCIVQHLEDHFRIGPEDNLLEAADAGLNKLSELSPLFSGSQFQARNGVMM